MVESERSLRITRAAELIRERTGIAWEYACRDAERAAAERVAYGPAELRITWQPDSEPYDPGDQADVDVWRYVEQFGVYGCVIETRAPACPCCGRKEWEHAASLWSIVGDADYHREIERDLMSEVSA